MGLLLFFFYKRIAVCSIDLDQMVSSSLGHAAVELGNFKMA